MKKYLLIPILFIAAFAVSYADCGGCESHDHSEEKAECAKKCEKKCCSEKKKCCGEKSCCASKEKTEK